MDKLIPRQAVPPLSVRTLSGRQWKIEAQTPERFTLIVFYRGLHCPVCRSYITELNRVEEAFRQRGVAVIAISSDTRTRAMETVDRWRVDKLEIGFGLDLETAYRWGLYVSSSRGKTSIGIEEPAQFSEPGVFLIRPDRTLYWAAVQTMPFARPHFKEMLTALDFIVQNDYPARGEVVEPAP
jgi:peroxiredoxin